jgi:lysyl-tRNA synthetase class 2
MPAPLPPDSPPNPFSAIGRVVALPRPPADPCLAIYWQDRLLIGAAEPALLAGLAEGDLVRFTWCPEQSFSALDKIASPLRAIPGESADAWRWRRPGATASRMGNLRVRHEMLRAIRDWFHSEGFIEIETPALARAPSPEPQFAPVSAGDGWLITSPEFQLKRLLVGGFEKIYRIGPVFRGGEVGRLHNPEFTLLEWYRVDAGLDEMARDLESMFAVTRHLATALDGEGNLIVPADPYLKHRTQAAHVSLAAPFPRATVADLFQRHPRMDVRGATTFSALRRAASEAGVNETLPNDFEQAFFALWNRFEHELGRDAPLLVTAWPAPLASLARLKPGDASVAERMELLVGGIELANGFAELTDAAEQRRRFELDRALRRERGLPEVPLDERFLAALEEGLPPCAGMALGIDRLAMLLTGATHISEVLAFTWDER